MRLTTLTIRALTAVLTRYRADMPDLDNPVSEIIESRKTEKTYDWPGPLPNAARAAAPTMIHP
jgi:hypothetical protein